MILADPVVGGVVAMTSWLRAVLAVASVAGLVVGGVQMVMGPPLAERGKRHVLMALVGVVVAALASPLVDLVRAWFGG
jgi:hypothetical protein